MGETPQEKMKRLASEGGKRWKAERLYRKQFVYYTSRTFINTPSIIVSYSFPQALYNKKKRNLLTKLRIILTPSCRLAYVYTDSSKYVIALLIALIIAPYIILRSL
jgi:hypothetical protein